VAWPWCGGHRPARLDQRRRNCTNLPTFVTAAHVLEELIATNRLERIGIPLGGSSAAVSNLGKCNIETFKITDPFDAAIIRFEQPELIAALLEGWRFLSPKDLTPIRTDMPNCLVAGYPRVTTRKAGWELSPKFFCFVSSLLSQIPEDANEVREGLDIFLQHREREGKIWMEARVRCQILRE
jgi:hypothetical protein